MLLHAWPLVPAPLALCVTENSSAKVSRCCSETGTPHGGWWPEAKQGDGGNLSGWWRELMQGDGGQPSNHSMPGLIWGSRHAPAVHQCAACSKLTVQFCENEH